MEQLEMGKYKNRTINIALIVVAVIIALIIYRKQVQDINTLRDTKEEETKKNVVLDDIGKLEQRIFAYKRLLRDKEMDMVISTITDMAKEAGIEIVSIRPGREQVLSDYTKLPVELEMKAFEYHSLGTFISKLESHTDVYIVENVRINSRSLEDALAVSLKVSSIEYTESDTQNE